MLREGLIFRVTLRTILQCHVLLWTVLPFTVVYCEKYCLILWFTVNSSALYCGLLWTVLPYTVVYCEQYCLILWFTVKDIALYCGLLWTVLPYAVFYCEQYCFILCFTVNSTALCCVLLWTTLPILWFTVNSIALYCVLLWTVLPYAVFYCEQHCLYCVLLWWKLPCTVFYCEHTALNSVLLWTILPYTLFYCDQHYYAIPQTVSQSSHIRIVIQCPVILQTCCNEEVSYEIAGWDNYNIRTVLSFRTFFFCKLENDRQHSRLAQEHNEPASEYWGCHRNLVWEPAGWTVRA
jgi:hypothetical protein